MNYDFNNVPCPAYVLDESLLDKNLELIDRVRRESGAEIIVALKACAMWSDVTDYIDLGTHGMFICEVNCAMTLSNEESMTYSYYHKNVKPKPNAKKKTGYVCKICGYVHEGDTLPDDFVCPICKHGASDFEKL